MDHLLYRTSVLEREVARLAILMEKSLAEKSNPSVLELEVARLRLLVEKVIAEKANPPAEPNNEKIGTNHRIGATELSANEPSVMEPTPTVFENSVMEPTAIQHALVESSSADLSVMESSAICAGQLQPAPGQNVPQNDFLHPDNPETSQEDGGCDSTGLIIHDSFDANLNLQTAAATSRQLIVTNLRKDPSYKKFHEWNPSNPDIRAARGDIIRWVLDPRNIHKFKNNQPLQLRENSACGELFREVFRRQIRDGREKKLKKAFSLSCLSRCSNLAKFLSGVVKVHTQYCSTCD